MTHVLIMMNSAKEKSTGLSFLKAFIYTIERTFSLSVEIISSRDFSPSVNADRADAGDNGHGEHIQSLEGIPRN